MYRRNISAIWVYESIQYMELYNTFKQIENHIQKITGFDYKAKLDNDQFVQYMGISKQTALQWRNEQRIKFSLKGKKIYYTKEDIAQFIKNHHVSSIK